MKKTVLLLSFLAGSYFFSAPALLADEAGSGGSTSTMREISEKQDEILKALEEIKTEINIVKIRVSSS